jgi:hypothetical protein
MANNKVIYSVLLGDYDNFNPAPKYSGWDYVVFTDNAKLNADGWKIRVVDGTNDLQKESKKYKFLSHVYLSEYDLVCYVDSNIWFIAEPPSNPIWFSNAKRDRVMEQAKEVIRLGLANEDQVSRQMRYYLEYNFPDKGGLYDNKFFVRNNRNEVQNKLMQRTWDIVSEYTSRDELALPFAMWSLQYKMENIKPYSVATRFITVQPHKVVHSVKKSVAVHHITPGRADKNIGKAINTIIRGLPDDDWICLRDIDTLPMYHEKIYQQCEEIASAGEFDLVGCMTNRLGLHYQLVGGQKSDDSDIANHRKIALELYKEHGNDIKVINQAIGGLFMLFSKKTWEKVGGFPEGGIQIKGHFFDYHFCKQIMKHRLRIGIAKGIYLFHYYRFESGQDTRRNISHLL